VTHLILSQGIGFGTGGCLAYTPTILFMSEWFAKRKGLAFGIVWVSDLLRCNHSIPNKANYVLRPGPVYRVSFSHSLYNGYLTSME
jgi:hypothetical protein